MKTYLISDCHLNHAKIRTWCDRPEDFTERIDRNVMQILKPGDLLLNLGDFGIGNSELFMETAKKWSDYGIKHVLVRGNHDGHSPQWYMDRHFDFACDAMVYRGALLTHKPWLQELPDGTHVNVHGHLHNVWDGFYPDDPEAQNSEFVVAAQTGKLLRPFHRLFAVEYTNYAPVEMDRFIAKPDKYQARGPNSETLKKIRFLEQERDKEKLLFADKIIDNWKSHPCHVYTTIDPVIECGTCFDEEGSYNCVRPSHATFKRG